MATNAHHVFDENTNLDSFSYSPRHNHISVQAVYVPDVTPVPAEGEVIEIRVFGGVARALVTYTSLMAREETLLHVQANRIKD